MKNNFHTAGALGPASELPSGFFENSDDNEKETTSLELLQFCVRQVPGRPLALQGCTEKSKEVKSKF